jgi:RNA polymerase sigma-70 factor, ECF subfamily
MGDRLQWGISRRFGRTGNDQTIIVILYGRVSMGSYDMNELVDKYSRQVFNLAYRITGNRPDAEDVVQETFLQVYEHLDSFKGESTIYTWIYKIALNNCLKLKKKMDRAYVESLDEKVEMFKRDIPAEVQEWYTDPEKAAYIGELLAQIRTGCLHFLSFRLPENQRIVYVMRNILDFSYRDISEILGIGENVIKARLNRARASLMEFFSSRCQWLTEDNTCTCQSRIGFALALDPEILRKVKAQAVDAGIVSEAEMYAVYKPSIDELYRKFPMLEYRNQELKEKLANF